MQFSDSRSVKCVTRTTKVDNSVLPEPEIFSFITRFLLENRVFLPYWNLINIKELAMDRKW
jgi:hypothetical protein